MTDLIGHLLSFFGVCLTAWVAWKVGIVVHQNNSMRHELQQFFRMQGRAEGRQLQKDENSKGKPA